MNKDFNFNLDDIIEETRSKRRSWRLDIQQDLEKNKEENIKVGDETIDFGRIEKNKDDSNKRRERFKKIEDNDDQSSEIEKIEDSGEQRENFEKIEDNDEQGGEIEKNKEPEKFDIDIDYNKSDFIIDETLVYEDSEEDNSQDVMSKFFRSKKKIKYNFEESDNLKEKPEKFLDQARVFEILKKNNRFLIGKVFLLVISMVVSISGILLASVYDLNYWIINICGVINCFAMILAGTSCSDIIIKGLKALVKKNGSFDSIVSFACFGGILQAALCVFRLEEGIVSSLYIPSIILILLFYRLSQFKLHGIMKLKSRFVSRHNKLYDMKFAVIKNLLDPDDDGVMCFSETKEQRKRDYFSYNECGLGLEVKNILIYIILAMSILVSVGCFFVSDSLYSAVSCFCCLLILSIPLSKSYCFKFILSRAAKKMAKNDVLLSKYSAIDQMKKCHNIIINNDVFFNENSFKLIKMKIFDYGQINDSIIDIASLLYRTESILSKVFLDILGNKGSLLKSGVDVVRSEEGGIVGRIGNKNIIFGNNDYLLDNNVVIPSKYLHLSSSLAEDKSLKTMYVAIDGYLTAMFLIKVTASNRVELSLKKLEKNDLKLTVCLKDPFISSEDISYIYNIDRSRVEAISLYDKENINSREIGVLHSGQAESLIMAVVECKKIKHRFDVCLVLEILSIVITSCFVITFVALNVLLNISFISLMTIQLFWFLLVFVISNLGR